MEAVSLSDAGFRIVLRCRELDLEVEFRLRYGQYARLGSAPSVEIQLPIRGISDEEICLYLDGDGLLWMWAQGQQDGELLRLPATLMVGEYEFAAEAQEAPGRSPRDSPAAVAPTVPVAAPPEPSVQQGRGAVRTDISAWKLACAVAVMLFGAMIVWKLARRSESSAGLRDQAGAAGPPSMEALPVSGAARPVSEVPDPEPAVAVDESAPKPDVERVSDSEGEMDIAAVARDARPAILQIKVMDYDDKLILTGTGFVVSGQGLAVTSHAVVASGHRMVAETGRGVVRKVARLVIDDSFSGLAVVQLEDGGLPFLELGDDSDVEVGQQIVVCGNSGDGWDAVSRGILSAIHRQLDPALPNGGDLFQMSAAVAPSSIGAPVLGIDGRVVGVVAGPVEIGGSKLDYVIPGDAVLKLRQRAVALGLKQAAEIPAPAAPAEAAETRGTQSGTDEDAFHRDADTAVLKTMNRSANHGSTYKLAASLGRKYPDSPSAQYAWGQAAVRLRLFGEAEKCFQRAVSMDGKDYLSWYALGSVHLRTGEAAKALPAFERVATLEPRYSYAWKSIVSCHLVLKDWQKVDECMNRLADLDRDEASKAAKLVAAASGVPNETRILVSRFLDRQSDDDPEVPPSEGREVAGEAVVDGISAGDVLNVRSGAGTEYPAVGSLQLGSVVEIMARDDASVSDSDWVLIRSNQTKGWVRSKFLVGDGPRSIALRWVKSFLMKGTGSDPGAEVLAYAPVVMNYFGDRNLTRDLIRVDIEKYRREWPQRRFTLVAMDSARMVGADQLQTVYRFRYEVSGGGKKRAGVIRQETFFRVGEDGEWKIVSIGPAN